MHDAESRDGAHRAPAKSGDDLASETRGDTVACFDGWRFCKDRGELWKAGSKIAVQDKPLRVLEELLLRPGELVTRRHLITALWPNRIVDFETGLNTAIKKLRAALGDDTDHPRYIETVPRKGYRFIGRLDEPESSAPARSPEWRAEPAAAVRRRLPTRWVIAILSVVAAAFTWTVWPGVFGVASTNVPTHAAGLATELEPGSSITSSAEAFELYLRAKERITQIMPNEPELSPDGLPAPRAQVLRWLDEALRLDPSFAHAYVLRARAHLDFFVANLDVSDERLRSVHADLERARRVSGAESLGSDVRGLYAAFVDVDPERGLRELGYGAGTNEPAALLNQARVLTSMGRFRESDALLQRLLLDAPADQLMLRMRVSNLTSENRAAELFRLVHRLREISPPQTDFRSWMYILTGVPEPRSVDGLGEIVAAASADTASEQLFAVNSDLTFLRHQKRYRDVKRILDGSKAETLRFGSFIGASPGLGHRPVAELRGWNELLLGNSDLAAQHGREVLAFVAAQREAASNGWVLHLLRAEGLLFVGDHAGAVSAVHEAMRAQPLLQQVQAYRAYLAAITLAWAGAHDEAVNLLEQLTTGSPQIGPVRVVREPLITEPLRHDARFRRLAERLENEIRANQVAHRLLARSGK